jgi:D-alanyl-D-alanine carboxypeptidase
LTIGAVVALALPGAAAAHQATGVSAVQRGLEGLVGATGGPRGAIATIYRDRHLTVVSAGRANIDHPGAPRRSDHMRIASVSKAFNGAVVLHLVQHRLIGLDDTIGRRLPNLPATWSAVTVRQMLDHTSGLPDYTKSDAFVEQLTNDPQGFVAPATVLSWVASQSLNFPPGSRYEYSNTDNIVLGLIAEAATGESYARLLRQIVFGPAKLRQTTFPTAVALPAPFIHGYAFETDGTLKDVSTFLSPSGAWASGAIVSTPADLNQFIRDLLTPKFFGRTLQRTQLHFVRGSSSPAGPGVNSAGLGIFRYHTRCGTVYGHTGNIPGYTQFAAASRDGSRAVTMSLNIPAPHGALLERLRSVETTAVCALLRGKH